MSFQSIIGQDLAIQIIRKSLAKKSVAHAYLFYGPESVGKKLTAFEFARALNCVNGPGDDGCGQCSACRKTGQGNHPDYFFVEPAKNSPTAREGIIRIDAIRELQRKLSYLPYEGKWKVAVLDGADQMNPQAANSFLKTLEEPPSATVLILIATNLHQLPPTIVSRCQGIQFHRLPETAVRQILAGREEVAPEELDLRAAQSLGQIARALSPDLVENGEFREALLQLIDGVSHGRLDLVFGWSKTWAKKTGQLNPALDQLMNLLRDLALIRACGDSAPVHNRDLVPRLIPVAKNKSLEALITMFDAVQETKQALAGNANTQLSLENLLLNFCDAA